MLANLDASGMEPLRVAITIRTIGEAAEGAAISRLAQENQHHQNPSRMTSTTRIRPGWPACQARSQGSRPRHAHVSDPGGSRHLRRSGKWVAGGGLKGVVPFAFMSANRAAGAAIVGVENSSGAPVSTDSTCGVFTSGSRERHLSRNPVTRESLVPGGFHA